MSEIQKMLSQDESLSKEHQQSILAKLSETQTAYNTL